MKENISPRNDIEVLVQLARAWFICFNLGFSYIDDWMFQKQCRFISTIAADLTDSFISDYSQAQRSLFLIWSDIAQERTEICQSDDLLEINQEMPFYNEIGLRHFANYFASYLMISDSASSSTNIYFHITRIYLINPTDSQSLLLSLLLHFFWNSRHFNYFPSFFDVFWNGFWF